jgi:hypothetical protein
VSLTARFVSHPTIDFGAGHRAARRLRLGLARRPTVYHRPRAARAAPTIVALRPGTSSYRFPSVARPGRVRDRRAVLPLGLPRVRRA